MKTLMVVMMMIIIVIIIIIIINGVKRLKAANLEVLRWTQSIWFCPPPHTIYHSVTFPSFAGSQNKGFPKDFLTEILYTFPKPL
jgi:hypothetical protein